MHMSNFARSQSSPNSSLALLMSLVLFRAGISDDPTLRFVEKLHMYPVTMPKPMTPSSPL